MGVPTSYKSSTVENLKRNNNRKTLCLPSSMVLLTTGCFLFLIISTGTPGCEGKSILEIAEPKFTQWNQTVTYVSSTAYNARGMAPLYNATNFVIRLFIGDDAIPEGYVTVNEQTVALGPKVENNEWGDLLKHYWALLLVIIITALIVVLMPIIGLCFCCCRCAGACGGRSQPFDKKHDTCRRAFLGLLLIGSATGLLFGVVVAFVTNAYMQDGIDESTTTLRHGMDDTRLFMESTSSQVNYLLVENYKELSRDVDKMLKDTAHEVISKLEQESNAISLRYLTEFVNQLPQIKLNLNRMRVITNELRVNASQLSDGLRGVKRELLVQLTRCTSKPCQDILVKYEIGKLDASGIDYNQLPDITEIISSVEDLVSQNVSNEVEKGLDKINDITKELNKTIAVNIPEVQKTIDKAGQEIRKNAEQITKQLQSFVDIAGNHTYKAASLADEYIAKYSMYRYYVGIAISSILLLVLLCVTLALFCGVCGKRPDGYGDDCCNKGSGSRFLMLGVTVMFLTISVIAIIILAHFLSGLILQRAVCIPLQNPETDQIFQQYYDDFIDLNALVYPKQTKMSNSKLPPFRLSELVTSCHANKTIYEVANLHYLFDIKQILDYPDNYKIEVTLRKLAESITIPDDIEIINKQTEDKIKELANSRLNDFKAYQFEHHLNDTITNHKLSEIAEKLRETADKIKDEQMTDIRVSLRNQALHLETYQHNLVQPMTDQSRELLNLANSLEMILQPNGTQFDEQITRLLNEIKNAQEYIKTNGTETVQQIANELIDGFSNEINTYLQHVVNSILTAVGRCGPIARVYDSLLVAGCNRIVDPFNGFWAGVGWCILVFLPTIIISVKLSSLYQKSDPYPGPLVESEYLYDAYSERDNIPLANGPKNKRRKTKDRRRSSRDRRGDYYEDSGSSHGAPSGRDTRYSDMAPKSAATRCDSTRPKALSGDGFF